jgi:hypothetical protein
MFHVVTNIFSLISNKVLISLHNCLDSTYTNCPAACPPAGDAHGGSDQYTWPKGGRGVLEL